MSHLAITSRVGLGNLCLSIALETLEALRKRAVMVDRPSNLRPLRRKLGKIFNRQPQNPEAYAIGLSPSENNFK